MAEGVTKVFGETVAVDELSFSVDDGTILGLLGPNGAGKTTTVQLLSTLTELDAGRATVAGFDVERDPAAVRRSIGVAGQAAAVDEKLTAIENLEIFGRLYHLPKPVIRERTGQLVERFELVEFAARPVETYSGGERRRLDIAVSLVARPPVLFLDEPTTGLDPRSRLRVWEEIGRLRAEGTTIILTTQYLEEADHLADRIVIIDRGRTVAEGRPSELKAMLGQNVLELELARIDQVDEAEALLRARGWEPSSGPQPGMLRVPGGDGASTTVHVLRAIDDAGIQIRDLGLRRPTLDDVFLTLTDHDAARGDDAPSRRADPTTSS